MSFTTYIFFKIIIIKIFEVPNWIFGKKNKKMELIYILNIRISINIVNEMITAQDYNLLQEKSLRTKKILIITSIIIAVIIFSQFVPFFNMDFYRHMNYVLFFICSMMILLGIFSYFLALLVRYYLLKDRIKAYEFHLNIDRYRRLVSEIPTPINLLRQKYHRYHKLVVTFCILSVASVFIIIFNMPKPVEVPVNHIRFEIFLLSLIPIFVVPQIILYFTVATSLKQFKLYSQIHTHDQVFNQKKFDSNRPEI